jgi:hypothetical protein
MEIIIACLIAYALVSPDRASLALTRGLFGMARGAATGKPTKKSKPSPRRRAMLDGWREGKAAARERREAGKDLWSRGTRLGGRVVGGTGSLARGIKGTVDARRGNASDASTAVVDEDGKPVTAPDSDPAEPAGPSVIRRCSECGGELATVGQICPACLAKQQQRDQSHDKPGVMVLNPDDPFGPPAYEGDPEQAHNKLEPGTYATTDPDQALVVTDDTSVLQRREPAAPLDEPQPTTTGNTTSPNGAPPMSIATTDLQNIDELDREIKTVQGAFEGVMEAMEVLRKYGINLPERMAAAPWGTAGIDRAVMTMAETVGQLKMPEVLEAIGGIKSEIAKARGVGEVAATVKARGKVEALQGS